MLFFEEMVWRDGFSAVGVDEAGRGPLAGPVFAAAVSIAPDAARKLYENELAKLTDSKKLSARARREFRDFLVSSPCVRVGIGSASAAEIDSLNILNATHLAMRRAADFLEIENAFILVDGLPVKGLPFPSRAIVKGDAKSLLIAAASVVAKVTRDELMESLDAQYPGYGFAKHKGYGTAEHLAALRALGPSPIHRKSFAPVSTTQLKLAGF